MREKVGFGEVVFFWVLLVFCDTMWKSFSSSSSSSVFLFPFCLKPYRVSDVHASNTGSWLCRGLLFPISYCTRFLFVGNWHLLWNVHQCTGHCETWGNQTKQSRNETVKETNPPTAAEKSPPSHRLNIIFWVIIKRELGKHFGLRD